MKTETNSDAGRAFKRLHRVKNFYTHLTAWVTVNLLLFIGSRTWTYIHPDFWDASFAVVFALGGFGLLGHFMGVFGYRIFFSEKKEKNALALAFNQIEHNNNNNKTEPFMEPTISSEQLTADRARRKVKALKGFYKHLAVYIVVNVGLLLTSYFKEDYLHKAHQEFWSFQTFSTAIFWGIGVLCHAFNTFGMGIIFGNDWEERKIREYMEAHSKQDSNTTKWE